MSMNDEYLIIHNGRRTYVKEEPDEGMGPPWKEHDGHGPVRDGEQRCKRAGERAFGARHLYDWQAAIKLAKKDGWGWLGVNEMLAFAWRHKRLPTKGELAVIAVQKDFDRLKGWCDDDWYWVSLHVTDAETGVDDWLGGIESDDDASILECAHEIAEDFYERVVWAELSGNKDAA